MKKVLVAFAGASLAVLVFGGTALAGHARPQAASPLTFKFVPAYDACTPANTNASHGAPLALPACSPPTQTEQEGDRANLTWNAPDRAAPFNGPEEGTGSLSLKVTCLSSVSPPVENGDRPPCAANGGDQADVKITVAFTGLRCFHASQGRCSGAGSLYNGMIGFEATIRMVDHFNARDPNPPGPDCSDTQSCPGTMQDIPFGLVGGTCTGGSCNFTTSMDAIISDMVREGKRTDIQLGQAQIRNGGLDGSYLGGPPPLNGNCPPSCTRSEGSDRVAFVQGLAVP